MQNQVQQGDQQEKLSRGKKEKTALESSMTADQISEMEQYLCDSFTSHSTAMTHWKRKMKRFEDRMEDDFKDRYYNNHKDYDEETTPTTIFTLQNDSLNVVGGFAEFAFAQAKSELFGTNPFLTVSPEGVGDQNLAETITKHSAWKGNQTNQKKCLSEALMTSVNLGTSFPKITWERKQEEYVYIQNRLVFQSLPHCTRSCSSLSISMLPLN